MKCPHCLVGFKEEWKSKKINSNPENNWEINSTICPTCKQIIVKLIEKPRVWFVGDLLTTKITVYPKKTSKEPLNPLVDKNIRTDYVQALAVIDDSPKASAALSRRCLQNLLVEKANVRNNSLDKQIQEVLKSNQLPHHLAKQMHVIRKIGNFATHPIKSQNSGTIIEVEEDEAEWLLELLKDLFEFYFVQPTKFQQRSKNLNKKLIDAGQKPIK